MKQFLQPMIEQVWGGGDVDVPLFCVSFLELLYFCVRFFNSPIPFQDRFYQYLHIFAVYYVHFIKKSNSVLGTNFRDVQLIPNFLRCPAWL